MVSKHSAQRSRHGRNEDAGCRSMTGHTYTLARSLWVRPATVTLLANFLPWWAESGKLPLYDRVCMGDCMHFWRASGACASLLHSPKHNLALSAEQ